MRGSSAFCELLLPMLGAPRLQWLRFLNSTFNFLFDSSKRFIGRLWSLLAQYPS